MRPTKYYSDRQESAIADFLGWRRTAASGARPFEKGDLVSPEFCGECKTKTSICEKIEVRRTDWRKIGLEAQSCMRKPILFTDNGTQKTSATFCLIQGKFCFNINPIQYRSHCESFHFKVTGTRFSVPYDILSKVCKEVGSAVVFPEWGESLYIMSLETFRSMIGGELDGDS
jgi:hypothetical protein